MSWPEWLDRRGFVGALVAVWALAYLPYLGTRDLRHEEGRRATPAREMLESGRYVCPTLYGDPYFNKPPMYPWLVAGAGAALGEVTPLAVRLPSALAALGTALLALCFARRQLDRRTRALAALFVLASVSMLDKGTLGEIDPTLTLLVAGALKVWWDGYDPDRHAIRSWIGTGVLLGLAGLLKGPAGPVLFYLGVGLFLMWQRRLGRLLTRGHLLGLGLTIGPGLGWAWLLVDGGHISRDELLTVWAHQIGLGKFLDLAPSPTDEPAFLINHYATFPFHLIAMCFPAVVWAGLAIRARPGLPDDVRRFLLCAAAGPALVLWLYPESRPRHVMPVLFPMAMLGAMAVGGSFPSAIHRPLYWRLAGVAWSLIPAVVGALGVLLAALKYPAQMLPAGLGLGVGAIWTCWSLGRTRATADRPIAVAVPLAGALLAAWGAANTVLFPGLADRGPARTALEPVAGRIGHDEVVYTTRRFPVRGDGYYNVQFHLARHVRGVDVDELPALAPCTVVVTTAEREKLDAAGVRIEEVGRIAIPNGPPVVWVVRLTK
jgi:4-amino-4-deoxy-L-arabinose transferase-like glycosyltransferase